MNREVRYNDPSVISLNVRSSRMSSVRPSKESILTAYRRSALLDGAIRVFGRSGFDRATMDEIAREADVAKGTTYLYYPSKQSIYDAALAKGFADMDQATRPGVEDAPNLRHAISAFVAARTSYFFEHRDFFRMYVATIASEIAGGAPRGSRCGAMLEHQTRPMEQAVSRAVARREIRRVDPAATALAIFDLTRGLVARRMMSVRAAGVAEDAAFLADLIWRGLTNEAVKRRSRGSAARGTARARDSKTRKVMRQR
jgi:AcrR family transcriptional regulator